MPLLLTPADPFQTTSHLPAPAVYAIIDHVAYDRRGLQAKVIRFSVAYYASEAACAADAAPLSIDGLPTQYAQPATPEEADGVPVFSYLEQVLTARLLELLPGLAIANVA